MQIFATLLKKLYIFDTDLKPRGESCSENTFAEDLEPTSVVKREDILVKRNNERAEREKREGTRR